LCLRSSNSTSGKQPGRPARAAKHQREEANRSSRRELHMRLTIRDLDRMKEITSSDRISAMVLGITPADICDVRKLRKPLAPMASVKLAKAMKAPLFPALALALSATARCNSARQFWLDLAVGRWP
jgi:hypothetical protein